MPLAAKPRAETLDPSSQRDLSRFFLPRTIAILGASDDRSKYGGKCLDFIVANGFRGKILPLHPTLEAVQGLKAYKSLRDLPIVPDLVLVILSRGLVLDAVQDAAGIGVRNLVLFSSGFAEADDEGAQLQSEVLEIARAGGITVLGPNCVGIIGCEASFVGSFAGALSRPLLEPGPVSLLSQSGAMLGSIFTMATERGVRFNCAVNPGNEMDIGTADFMEFLAEDPGTRSVVLVLEGVRDGLRFRQACEKLEASGKPVIVLKSGRTDKGRELAYSHTANIAGDDAAFDALMQRHGFLRVHSLTDLMNRALAVSCLPMGDMPTVGIFSGSGGAAVMLADAATDAGLAMPAPSAETVSLMQDRISAYAVISNPFDATADLNRRIDQFLDCLDKFVADPQFGGAVVMRGQVEIERGHAIADGIIDIARRHGKPIVVFWPSDRSLEAVFDKLRRGGVLAYADPFEAIDALATRLPRPSVATAHRPAPDVPLPQTGAGHSIWSEASSKAWLGRRGLPVPRGRLVRDGAEAEEFVASLDGPFAVKLQADGLVHKTEVGGVLLRVAAGDVAARVAEMLARAGSLPGIGAIEGVLVEQMVGLAAELIVGARRDPTLGWFLVLGPGGVQTELFPAPQAALLPVRDPDIDRLLGQPAVARIMAGFRGGAPVARGTIVALLAALQRAILDAGDGLVEFESNPVGVLSDGSVAMLDATLIWDAPERQGAL